MSGTALRLKLIPQWVKRCANFQITEHSLYGGIGALTGADSSNAFCTLSITHEAANNLGHEAAQIMRSTDVEQGSYRNRFDAAPASARIVPMPVAEPTAPGLQTAIVVADEGEPLTTDRDHRIRIQFGWQRGASPLAGGLSAPSTLAGADTGHAPGNAQSGTWVRVAQGVAGPNWGAVFTPRAGTEVLVDFVDGDIDRPIVVGQLHNGQHDLPWPAGVDSGANHPGTVSGWHHPHLDGQGANQWLVDDANSICWMTKAEFDKLKSKDDWRRHFAVWANWNSNGEFVTYTVPPGKPLKVWEGKAASQNIEKSDYYLEGGGRQIVLDPTHLDKGMLGKRQSTNWGYSSFGEKLDLVGVPTLKNYWFESKK